MKKVWEQGRDGGKVGMGCVQERPPYVQHPQATSAYISLHVVFGEILRVQCFNFSIANALRLIQ